MRITYGISFDDFLSLQRPFTLRAGRNAGFVAAMFVCLLMVALGVIVGAFAGFCIMGFGLAAAVAAWFYEKRAVAAARKKYDDNLARIYQGIHCRDQRTFETTPDSFTMACNCGTVTRPWSELVRITDTRNLLLVGMKKGVEAIPKSCFASEGTLTEFRTTMMEKLNQGNPLPVRQFEFSYRRADFRSAAWLHIWEAGGRRNLFFFFIKAWGFAVIAFFVFTKLVGASENTAFWMAAGTGVGFIAARLLKANKKPAVPPARVYFDQQGLHVEDSASRMRFAWDQFIGYLENKNVFLLYLGPRHYKIIPKRALDNRAVEFSNILRSRVRLFDYKNPSPVIHRPAGAAAIRN